MSIQATLAQTSDTAQITLYDADRSTPVASAASVDGVARLDTTVAVIGERYYVKLTGNTTQAVVRMGNQVSQSGTTLNVTGATGDDSFAYAWDTLAGGSVQTVTVNGIPYTFTPTALTTVNFDGVGGTNTATLEGTNAAETATLRPGTAKFVVATSTVNVSNTGQITVDGQGGADVVNLYGSSGNDTFVAGPTAAVLSGSGYTNTAHNCAAVYGFALTGSDTAQLSDSSGNDRFTSYPAYANLQGTGFFIRAVGFDSVTATASAGGSDVAVLNDSTGDDTFVGRPGDSTLSGTGFSYRAVNFRAVQAIASSGNDQATLEGSTGNDSLRIDPGQAYLYGSGYSLCTKGFDAVAIDASQGGSDKAYLYASSGDDLLQAQSAWAQLSSTLLGYQFHLSAFGYVKATAAASSNQKHVVTPLGYTLVTSGPWTDI